ncbi:acetyl esterase/lipase [Kineococcus radiotolerans]|uniref:Acetyl esterase/lipase n=1 Tax=Kineococcus radiotolerans TaxID=131568 RepID=A0A7W4TQV6_KINRA|nr:alpha/beta hydrolase [Kineococcus radiotolerans]MBB2903369.1 acetyl esterase/lipase [Kineococcus radiotolerans]
MTTAPLRTAPPFDAELNTVLKVVNESISPTLLPEHLPVLRGPGFTPTLEQLLEGRAIEHEERWIPGPAGDLLISIFRPREQGTSTKPAGPGLFFTHVGGLIFGDRFVGVGPVVDLVEPLGAVVVTVEYRLAPENPAPAAAEDSYAALVWTAEHADELGIDPERLITIGGSAGGGLTAAITLMARDRGLPALAGQVLMYPMLDEHNDSTSARQIDGIGIWDRTSNDTGWNFALGARRGTQDVSAYESPSRASDLSNLPPTYLEVGSAEVFRDETVDYASRIWADGGDAELHVWPGGYHLFELLAPEAALSRAARDTRNAWLARLLQR